MSCQCTIHMYTQCTKMTDRPDLYVAVNEQRVCSCMHYTTSMICELTGIGPVWQVCEWSILIPTARHPMAIVMRKWSKVKAFLVWFSIHSRTEVHNEQVPE